MELGQFNMMLMDEGGVWRIWFYVQHVVGCLKCVLILGVCVFVCLGWGEGGSSYIIIGAVLFIRIAAFVERL